MTALLRITLQSDGQAPPNIEDHVTAISGGDLEKCTVRQHFERPDLVEDGTNGFVRNRVANAAVVDCRHVSSSPSLIVNTESVGDRLAAGPPFVLDDWASEYWWINKPAGESS